MKLKPGVTLAGIHKSMRLVLINAEAIWAAHGQELVITSARNGAHSAGSLHYYGLALDMRTRYFEPEEAMKIGRALREVLGADYDVVVHKGHIHTEFDPKQEV